MIESVEAVRLYECRSPCRVLFTKRRWEQHCQRVRATLAHDFDDLDLPRVESCFVLRFCCSCFVFQDVGVQIDAFDFQMCLIMQSFWRTITNTIVLNSGEAGD